MYTIFRGWNRRVYSNKYCTFTIYYIFRRKNGMLHRTWWQKRVIWRYWEKGSIYRATCHVSAINYIIRLDLVLIKNKNIYILTIFILVISIQKRCMQKKNKQWCMYGLEFKNKYQNSKIEHSVGIITIISQN